MISFKSHRIAAFLLAVHFQIVCLAENCNGQTNFKDAITFLSSNKLGGRCPGTSADSIVQNYISNQFRTSELAFPPSLCSYYQELKFPDSFSYTGKLACKNGVDSRTFLSGLDFKFSTQSKEDSLTSEIVYIGYGITNQEERAQPFGQTLQGKVVIANQSLPSDATDSVKDWIQNNKHNSVQELKIAGAKAILYILPKEYKISGNTYKGDQKKDEGVIIALIDHQLGEYLIGKDILQNYEKKLNRQEISDEIILRGKTLTIVAKKQTSICQTANIIGLRKGSDDEYIIIGAHHDHLCANSKNDAVFPGANDNASGISMMLALTKYFQQNPTNCTILFIAFAAEERGLLGSKYFWNNLPVDRAKIRAMINLDMIGCMENDSLYHETCNVNNQQLLYSKAMASITNLYLKEKQLGVSDSYIFDINSIPTIYLSTGMSSTLHSPKDNKETINYAGMEKSYPFLVNLVKVIDENSPKEPVLNN